MAPYWHPPLILRCDFLCPYCSRKAYAVCFTSSSVSLSSSYLKFLSSSHLFVYRCRPSPPSHLNLKLDPLAIPAADCLKPTSRPSRRSPPASWIEVASLTSTPPLGCGCAPVCVGIGVEISVRWRWLCRVFWYRVCVGIGLRSGLLWCALVSSLFCAVVLAVVVSCLVVLWVFFFFLLWTGGGCGCGCG